MADFFKMYQEPMYLYFAVGSVVVSMAAFFIFAIPYTLLYFSKYSWVNRYRVQPDRINRKLILPSIVYAFLNPAIALTVVSLLWPILRFSGVHAGVLPAWYEIVWQVVFFIVLDDFLFYGAHYLLHKGWLYKKVHSFHHRITASFALAGNYMHPIEFLVISGLVLLGPVLLGSHVVTLYAFIIFRQWEAAEGHCGLQFRWNPMHLIPFYDGPAFHEFHHWKFTGNYAAVFSYMDKMFGTFSRGYVEYMAALRSKTVNK